MRLILDTNEYIFALDPLSSRPWSIQLFDTLIKQLDDFQVFVPDIIRDEVQHNLPRSLLSNFYRLIMTPQFIHASLFDMPQHYFHKYRQLGLKQADATIAAFAEWQQVDLLISENRHFLRLQADSFTVLDAEQFLTQLKMEI
jgi:hypothetical protein